MVKDRVDIESQLESIINLDSNTELKPLIAHSVDNDIESGSDSESEFDVYVKGTKNITGRQTLLIIPILRYFNSKINLNKLIPILDGTSPISLRLIDWFVTNYCKKFNTMYNVKKYQPPYNCDRSGSSNSSDISGSGDNKKNDSIGNGNGNGSPSLSEAIANLDITNTPTTKKRYSDNFDNYFIVHSNYKGQLKTCNKKNFDPFCRRNRIQFYYTPNRYFITTVGQLNFFKWAIENHIIDYIAEYIKDIENDMNSYSKVNQSTQAIPKLSCTVNQPNSTTLIEGDTTKKKKGKRRSKKNSTRKKRKELSVSASRSMYKHQFPTTISFD